MASANRTGRWRVTLLAAAAVILAAVLGFVTVPALIRSAYEGTSLEFFNRAVSGQDRHPVETYLSAWRRLFLGLVGITAIGIGAIAAMRVASRRDPIAKVARAVSGPPAWPASFVVGLACWIGAVGGMVQGGHQALRYLIERHASRPFQWEAVWMAPLGEASVLVLLTAAALAVLALGRWLRNGLVWAPGAVFVLTVLAVGGILSDPTLGLAPIAVWLLAAGLASVAFRRTRAAPESVRLAVRRTAPFLAGLLAVSTTAGLFHLPSAVEGRRTARLGRAPADAPNVLIILLDTVRASNLGLYGYARPTTPNLDRVFRTGVVFDRAIAPAPWSLPTHASLFTGRWPHELNTNFGIPLDDTYPTLAEIMADLGYHTAAFVANTANGSESTGLDRGFARYEDYPVTPGRVWFSTWLGRSITARIPGFVDAFRLGRKDARANTADFLRWLERRPAGRPFFVFMNYMDAHAPYLSPPRFRARFPSDRPVIQPGLGAGLSVEELDGTRAAYDAAIAYLDEEIGRLLATLDQLRLGSGTIVVLTSDHGEFMGEHGLVDHGGALYAPTVWVPLAFRGPGIPEVGRRVVRPVSLRDVPATILDLVAGASDPRLGGVSLAPLWSESAAAADSGRAVLTQTINDPDRFQFETPTPHTRSTFVGHLQYIQSSDGREELYDLTTDPGQLRDLSSDPRLSETLAWLRRVTAEFYDDTEGGPLGNR